MMESDYFGIEGIEAKIGEYDKRIMIFINHMIETGDYSIGVIKARKILESKMRQKIEDYTSLFLKEHPEESYWPVFEARKILHN